MESEIGNHRSSEIFRAPLWRGEFGWEVMTWAPWWRARSRAGPVAITGFADSRALYVDFAREFHDHGETRRTLDYPKGFDQYHSDGPGFEHYEYGDPDRAEPFDVLIHARGIARKRSINYRHWDTMSLCLLGLKCASIGTLQDQIVPGTRDLRGLPLEELMDLCAAADVTLGCSSGVMHLAAACGGNLVVWGDTKSRYRETLERRYRETWNPHHVRVAWLDADDWQPPAHRVVAALEEIASRTMG